MADQKKPKSASDVYASVASPDGLLYHIAHARKGPRPMADQTMSTDWGVIDEIEAAERRLQTFCGQVHAGERQGGGREFSRQIDAQFQQIRKAMGMPAFDPHWNRDSENPESKQ